MSVNSTRRTVFTVPTEGFVLVGQDLDDISLNSSRRAWEVPGYADLLGFDQLDGAYSSAWDGTNGRARTYGVYTKGGGLVPVVSGSLGSRLSVGMMGMWTDGTSVSPPLTSGANKMLWVMLDGEGPTLTHDACSAGQVRYDLVQCAVTEVNGPTVERDFQDAVTGDFSSGTPVTYRTVQVTFSVKKGVAATSPDIPAIPAPDAGYKCAYAALIDASSISSFLDFTIPAGPLKVYSQPATAAAIPGTSTWNRTNFPGALLASASAQELLLIPPCGGNGEARILGVNFRYQLTTGAHVRFMGINLLTLGTRAIAEYAGVTLGGSDHTAYIDLRSLPVTGGVIGPLWAGGSQIKESLGHWATALQVVSGSANDAIYGVEWIVLGG